MRRQLGILTHLLIPFVVLATVAVAQEKKEPDQRPVDVPAPAQAPLPKIDLPEFVITGQEAIDLPPSSKSLTEADRTYVAGPPTTGNRRETSVGAPANKELKGLPAPIEELNGRVSGGLGWYLSPSLDGFFSRSFGDGGILVHGRYASSKGHVQNAGWQQGAIEMKGAFSVVPANEANSGASLSTGITYAGESYRFYGARTPIPSDLLRSISDLGLSAGYGTRSSAVGPLTTPIDVNAELAWRGSSIADSTSTTENDVRMLLSASSAYADYQLSGTFEAATTPLSMPAPASNGVHTPGWVALHLSGSRWILPDVEALAALTEHLYRGNMSPWQARVFPDVTVRYYPIESVTLYGGLGTKMDRSTLRTFLRENPYIAANADIEPMETRFAARLGAEIAPDERLSMSVEVRYRDLRRYPTYADFSGAKVWEVVYLPRVTANEAELHAAYRLSSASSASATVALSDKRDPDMSAAVPYVAPLRAALAYHHLIGGVMTEVYAEYVGRRPSDFSKKNFNAAYVLAGGKAEYEFMQNLRAFVRVDNLLNQHYYRWDGYLERTFFAACGVSFRW